MAPWMKNREFEEIEEIEEINLKTI